MKHTATEHAALFVKTLKSEDVTVKEIVQVMIEDLIAEFGTGRINGRAIAKALFETRSAEADPTQTRDYLLFRLRETDHICRHSIGDGLYGFHPEPSCTPACRVKWEHTPARKNRPMSACCNIEVTTTGACPLCD